MKHTAKILPLYLAVITPFPLLNIVEGAGAALGTVEEEDADILSFERASDLESILADGSSVKLSQSISLLGDNSLQWDWRAGASVSMPLYNYQSASARMSPFLQTQCLVLWIYNALPSKGYVELAVHERDGEAACSRFYLDYKGWRTAHIPLSQMEGNAPAAGQFIEYSRLEISIPESHPEKSGRFHIDDVYTTMIDARHPSADYQAPHVRCYFNGSEHVTQWLNQKRLPERSELEPKEIQVTDRDLEAFRILAMEELEELIRDVDGTGLSDKAIEKLLKSVEGLKIREVQGDGQTYLQGPYITLLGQGLPPNWISEGEKSGRLIDIKTYQNTLDSLAQAYHASTDAGQKKILAGEFLLCSRAYLQSGWAAGSNMGALHHLGYSIRKVAPAFFMMKELLRQHNLLQEISDSLNWYAVSHVVNDPRHTDPDLDLFNTVLYNHYLAAMMHPDDKVCARHLLLLSQWLSRTFADDSKKGGFKHDGTAWHHWGHYPAYAKNAIDNCVIITNKLTGAGFPLSGEGMVSLQRAVQAILLYQQGDRIPRSLAGRHPLTGTHREFISSDHVRKFVMLDPVDEQLKELYNYHTGDRPLDGNWTLPYSAMSLHRRADFLAVVRGFSRYSWGAEIYNFNRFGRYQSYGTLDILYRDDQAFPYEGYDWNLNPGTTITCLPLEELESPIPIFMVTGTSRFANGLHDSYNMNGVHGFDLDDSMLFNSDPRYEEVFTKEKLTARKSTFFMDDLILCLGSNISGKHPTAPVYTVIAQTGVQASSGPALVNAETMDFPSASTSNGLVAIHDGMRTGYVAWTGDKAIRVSLGEQISRGDECTFEEDRRPPRGKKDGVVNQRREPVTRGNFFTAFIDHGIQPVDDRYLYVVLPDVDTDEFLGKSARLSSNPDLYFQVISSKSSLHAVRDVRNGTESYVFYEGQDQIPHSSLHAVSDPCLVLFRETEERKIAVSVALPDLHQTGVTREEKYKQWISRSHNLTLSFDGSWEISFDRPQPCSVQRSDGYTHITVSAQHGLSYHFAISLLRD